MVLSTCLEPPSEGLRCDSGKECAKVPRVQFPALHRKVIRFDNSFGQL